jgi:hypothetical protein
MLVQLWKCGFYSLYECVGLISYAELHFNSAHPWNFGLLLVNELQGLGLPQGLGAFDVAASRNFSRSLAGRVGCASIE